MCMQLNNMPHMELVDRKTEIEELRELILGEGPSASRKRLAVLYGRRRIGKTRLLRDAWPSDCEVLYFLASDSTPEFNRREFARTVADHPTTPSTLRSEDVPTWRTAFRRVFEIAPDEPLVVVLDEFQYLIGGEDDVRSQLAAVWDLFEPDRPLLVVLCGSAVRTMEQLSGGRAPLYGRLNWSHHLRPFDYWHTAQMTPFDSPRLRATAYGVYGGTPRYLETIDPGSSLRTNISEDVLSPSGEVRNLVETVVEQEGGFQSLSQYKAVLTAVAHGRTELAEISNFTGLAHDNALRRKVHKLRELGFVRRERNYGAPSNAPYRHFLRDPALRFHYSVVSSLKSALETTPATEMWDDHVAPRLSTHMGRIFESIVEQAYSRLRTSRDLPIVDEWRRWEGTDRNRNSIEIDVVARRLDDDMLTGSIKWSSQPVSAAIYRQHTTDLQRLADSGYGWAHDALHDNAAFLFVASNGFEESLRRAADFDDRRVYTWTLDDIYSDDAAGPHNRVRPPD